MIRPLADDTLTRLLASAEGRTVDYVLLQAVVEEASEAGAVRALASLGLEDPRARRDMDELRELLGAWRDVKKSAWRTAVRWSVRILLTLLMLGLALRLDVRNPLEP